MPKIAEEMVVAIVGSLTIKISEEVYEHVQKTYLCSKISGGRIQVLQSYDQSRQSCTIIGDRDTLQSYEGA